MKLLTLGALSGLMTLALTFIGCAGKEEMKATTDKIAAAYEGLADLAEKGKSNPEELKAQAAKYADEKSKELETVLKGLGNKLTTVGEGDEIMKGYMDRMKKAGERLGAAIGEISGTDADAGKALQDAMQKLQKTMEAATK